MKLGTGLVEKDISTSLLLFNTFGYVFPTLPKVLNLLFMIVSHSFTLTAIFGTNNLSAGRWLLQCADIAASTERILTSIQGRQTPTRQLASMAIEHQSLGHNVVLNHTIYVHHCEMIAFWQ